MDNFCCNCSHLLGKRHEYNNSGAWRCHHPNNVSAKKYNLVTGTPITELKEDSLEDLRSNQYKCGPDGAWFQLYVPPTYSPPPAQAVAVPATRTKEITPSLKQRLNALKAEDL